jgi:hypothetical protein
VKQARNQRLTVNREWLGAKQKPWRAGIAKPEEGDWRGHMAEHVDLADLGEGGKERLGAARVPRGIARRGAREKQRISHGG